MGRSQSASSSSPWSRPPPATYVVAFLLFRSPYLGDLLNPRPATRATGDVQGSGAPSHHAGQAAPPRGGGLEKLRRATFKTSRPPCLAPRPFHASTDGSTRVSRLLHLPCSAPPTTQTRRCRRDPGARVGGRPRDTHPPSARRETASLKPASCSMHCPPCPPPLSPPPHCISHALPNGRTRSPHRRFANMRRVSAPPRPPIYVPSISDATSAETGVIHVALVGHAARSRRARVNNHRIPGAEHHGAPAACLLGPAGPRQPHPRPPRAAASSPPSHHPSSPNHAPLPTSASSWRTHTSATCRAR